jgi:hypothetical protein
MEPLGQCTLDGLTGQPDLLGRFNDRRDLGVPRLPVPCGAFELLGTGEHVTQFLVRQSHHLKT